MAYARELAATASPRSTALIKRQLLAGGAQSFAESTTHAWDLLTGSFHSADFAEGVASFREKRTPIFTGR